MEKKIDIIPMKWKNWFYLLDYVNGKLMKFNQKNGLIKEIGSPDKDGYLRFGLDGKIVKIHRFLYEQFHNITLTSDIELNHQNRVRTDNRIDNLEISNRSYNNQNKEKQINNKSGFKGVWYNKQNKKWRAQININGKRTHLGYFITAELAYDSYKKKARELNKQGHKYYFDE